jgi:hypothetical protein
VLDHLDEYPNVTVACETVSSRLGFGAESLRRWARQAQIDSRQRDGMTSADVDDVAPTRHCFLYSGARVPSKSIDFFVASVGGEDGPARLVDCAEEPFGGCPLRN